MGAYLKSRWRGLALFALFFVLYAAVFWLYRLPVAAAGYGALLCAAAGLIVCGFDAARYLRRLRTVRDTVHSEYPAPDILPEPSDALERDYQALCRRLWEEDTRQRSESDRRFRETVDYYTLWAHQIKTPIAAMELMLQQPDPPDREELREQLFRVEQYAEMVLGYLRLDSDSSDLVIREYDLDAIVRRAVRRYASQFIRRRLRLEFQPLDARVLTDEKWLSFVVEQLLSNALKYTARGGVSIYMEPGRTLVIRDTGVGIAPADLPRVFEKGFTGFNGRAEERSTGLGLYLCKRTCDSLGHTLSIESVPGEGTTVRLGLANAALEVE